MTSFLTRYRRINEVKEMIENKKNEVMGVSLNEDKKNVTEAFIQGLAKPTFGSEEEIGWAIKESDAHLVSSQQKVLHAIREMKTIIIENVNQLIAKDVPFSINDYERNIQTAKTRIEELTTLLKMLG